MTCFSLSLSLSLSVCVCVCMCVCMCVCVRWSVRPRVCVHACARKVDMCVSAGLFCLCSRSLLRFVSKGHVEKPFLYFSLY